MPNYDFTVRATDNLGAYSDRTFTIAVKNTNVERFVVVGSTGLAHSPTGLPGTWTLESGVGNYAVAYGNGQWVNYGNGRIIRTSLDAVNWSSYNAVFGDAPGLPTGGVPTFVVCMKYRKQSWRMFGLLQYGGNTYRAVEYVSLDLVNWTPTGRTVAAPSGVTILVNDLEYDPVTDRWVVVLCDASNHQIWTATGDQPFTKVFTAGNTFRRSNGSVILVNGQWCMMGNFNPVISVDGLNWTEKTVAFTNGTPWSLVYTNGRLILHMRNNNSTSAQIPSNFSLNGGRTWATTGSYAGTNGNQEGPQSLAAYGNILVCPTGVNDQIAISQNSGTSWSLSTVSGLGSVWSVCARDD